MKVLARFLAALALLGLVFALGRCTAGGPQPAPAAEAPAAPAAAEVWTCPMHPQIRLPEAGDCPLCGMDLVLEEPGAAGGGDASWSLALSPEAAARARVETAPVERRPVTRPVHLVGKVDFDETAVRTISARVAGRLERLFVDSVGVRVERGEHLVRLYSPELLTAQEELLGARERLRTTADEASEFLAESSRRAYETAREKLLLYGLSPEQLAELEARGEPEEVLLVNSPASGVVVEKHLDEGAYVQTGTPIYEVADLARLWVRLDAYEQDLPWLSLGQDVELEAEALPGRPFEGRIAFIEPFVDERTRTASVRVHVDNRDGRLKPGMFVRGVASARVGEEGEVLVDHLEGKWISPMHPEIVKDGPGQCDVCGMDLVPAEELGLVRPGGAPPARPLVVPASAVLLAGRRAVVYVEVPDAERPTYEGREVRLGPRAGDEYVVLGGLEEGERVVVQGAFRVDSAMQIRAKKSLMSLPPEPDALDGPEARLFREALRPVQDAYLALQEALAADAEPAARAALGELATELAAVAPGALPDEPRAAWEELRARAEAAIAAGADAQGLAGLRAAFHALAEVALELERRFGHAGPRTLRAVHCPMAREGDGASWLQAGEEVANPFYGASMLRCGEVREVFEPAAGAGEEAR